MTNSSDRLNPRWTRMIWMVVPLVAALVTPATARATAMYATDTADNQTANGKCTLREAVAAANGDVCNDCGCGSGGDTIYLTQGATYPLNSVLVVMGDYFPNDELTIVGHPNKPIIKGNLGSYCGIDVRAGGSSGYGSLTMDNVKLTNFGASALIVRNFGHAFLTSVDVSFNRHAGSGQNAGVAVEGEAHLNYCALHDNSQGPKGGGLFVGTTGQVYLYASSIYANSSLQYGGGAHVQGYLSCVWSSLTDNRVTGTNTVYSGGGAKVTGTIFMDNCTLTNNKAPTCKNLSSTSACW